MCAQNFNFPQPKASNNMTVTAYARARYDGISWKKLAVPIIRSPSTFPGQVGKSLIDML